MYLQYLSRIEYVVPFVATSYPPYALNPENGRGT